jgi:hypothetical protein
MINALGTVRDTREYLKTMRKIDKEHFGTKVKYKAEPHIEGEKIHSYRVMRELV